MRRRLSALPMHAAYTICTELANYPIGFAERFAVKFWYIVMAWSVLADDLEACNDP